jgi:hypothetical protein
LGSPELGASFLVSARECLQISLTSCVLAASYQASRLWFHYLYLLIALFVNLLVYLVIFVYLRRHASIADSTLGSNSNASSIRSAALRMLLYPLANGLVVLPIATMRLAAIAGHQVPTHALVAAGVLLSLSGCINVIFYAFTRHIVTLTPSTKNRWTKQMGRSIYADVCQT